MSDTQVEELVVPVTEILRQCFDYAHRQEGDGFSSQEQRLLLTECCRSDSDDDVLELLDYLIQHEVPVDKIIEGIKRRSPQTRRLALRTCLARHRRWCEAEERKREKGESSGLADGRRGPIFLSPEVAASR